MYAKNTLFLDNLLKFQSTYQKLHCTSILSNYMFIGHGGSKPHSQGLYNNQYPELNQLNSSY